MRAGVLLMATLAVLALIALPLLLAYANGANDISKGIATLVGSGVSNLRAAVLWGTLWTVAGGLVATVASQGLVEAFSGKGFLASPIEDRGFLAAVAIGAIAWVLFASRTGLPVSTTHAITGALAGAGIVAQGAGVLHWSFLAKKAALPLALSPLLSVSLLYVTYPVLRRALARVDRYCLCLERRVPAQPGGVLAMSAVADTPVFGMAADCDSSPLVAGRIGIADGLHWFSSALTSFARGLNDTPKIVAVGIGATAIFGASAAPLYAFVALAIGAGSVIAGFRVTETLAKKVTAMSPAEGFSANLVTTLLVGAASWYALPVSTTHVSSGAIIGVGLHKGVGSVNWKTVGTMLLAWIVTLPTAALVGAGAYAILR